MTNTSQNAEIAIRPISNLTSFVISIVRRKQTKGNAENFLQFFFFSLSKKFLCYHFFFTLSKKLNIQKEIKDDFNLPKTKCPA